MKKIHQTETLVLKGESGFALLNNYLIERNFTSIVLVVDENTHKHCLPLLMELGLMKFLPLIFTLPEGEKSKSIESVAAMLSFLAQNDVPVNAVLISLGGGAVSDVTGFVASIYKRGIKVIHIPTSLIGMIDAAYGGKTGINFQSIKNLAGTYYFPDLVYLNHSFLSTLPFTHVQSGYGEMLKYGLLMGGDVLKRTMKLIEENSLPEDDLIFDCLAFKISVVLKDPFEKHERFYLNLGHTLGHAYESAFMAAGTPVSHGLAVAVGIHLALSISVEIAHFPTTIAKNLQEFIQRYFSIQHLPRPTHQTLMTFVMQDKKIIGKGIRMVLLNDLGKPHLVDNISPDLILSVLS